MGKTSSIMVNIRFFLRLEPFAVLHEILHTVKRFTGWILISIGSDTLRGCRFRSWSGLKHALRMLNDNPMKRRALVKWFGFTGIAAIGGGGFAVNRSQAANRYYSGPVSDHFDGRVFFNPDGTPPGSFSDLLRWQLGNGRKKWPESWPSPHPSANPASRVNGNQLRVTMVGHATLLIQTAGVNILTDPYWSERASPFQFAGPKRVNAPGIAFDDLPPIDIVLLTHNHYDHLDALTINRLKDAHDPLVVTPLGNDTIVENAVPGVRTVTGDWGDLVESHGLKLHFEPVHHWSARGTFDRRMALWCGFVVDGPGGKIYHVGDTGFHEGINYQAAREKHGRFRLAILPVGAYEPRWFMKGQHQNPAEAVEGFELCNAEFAAGHHWGTVQLTNEGIEEPRDALHTELDRRQIERNRFRAMQPGEAWDVPESSTT